MKIILSVLLACFFGVTLHGEPAGKSLSKGLCNDYAVASSRMIGAFAVGALGFAAIASVLLHKKGRSLIGGMFKKKQQHGVVLNKNKMRIAFGVCVGGLSAIVVAVACALLVGIRERSRVAKINHSDAVIAMEEGMPRVANEDWLRMQVRAFENEIVGVLRDDSPEVAGNAYADLLLRKYVTFLCKQKNVMLHRSLVLAVLRRLERVGYKVNGTALLEVIFMLARQLPFEPPVLSCARKCIEFRDSNFLKDGDGRARLSKEHKGLVGYFRLILDKDKRPPLMVNDDYWLDLFFICESARMSGARDMFNFPKMLQWLMKKKSDQNDVLDDLRSTVFCDDDLLQHIASFLAEPELQPMFKVGLAVPEE